VWFPAESLPVEPGARFAALFGLRPRWTREELDPFLEGWEVGGWVWLGVGRQVVPV
jgi:sister chromatid cohesion protein DCC1